MGIWARAKKSYKDLVARYGRVAVITYFTIFFSVLGAFWIAVQQGVDLAQGLQSMGFDTAGASSKSGTFVMAYGFTKLTQPIRIAATVVLTPLIARFTGREPSELPGTEDATGAAVDGPVEG